MAGIITRIFADYHPGCLGVHLDTNVFQALEKVLQRLFL